MNTPIHPRIKLWLDIGGLLYDSAEAAAKTAKKVIRERRHGSYATRRPGEDSPLWNICAELLRAELRPLGSKVRLARFLGIPKQRLNNFLTGHNRLPDAELTLQLLNWLAQKRAGRDISL
jgi:hypothetical protein